MNEENELRRVQFIKSLALASAAFKAGDLADTRYWLDGAHLILSSVARRKHTQEEINVSVA